MQFNVKRIWTDIGQEEQSYGITDKGVKGRK
jgi:hypothetical protein